MVTVTRAQSDSGGILLEGPIRLLLEETQVLPSEGPPVTSFCFCFQFSIFVNFQFFSFFSVFFLGGGGFGVKASWTVWSSPGVDLSTASVLTHVLTTGFS